MILEAAQAGCHLVCSDGGGILEIMKDYDMRGRVFPSEDVSLLAQALHEALNVVRKEPGIRQLQASQFEFQQQRHCQQTLAVYESLIKLGSAREMGRTASDGIGLV